MAWVQGLLLALAAGIPVMAGRRLLLDWWSFKAALDLGCRWGSGWPVALERGFAAVVTGALSLGLLTNLPFKVEGAIVEAVFCLCWVVWGEHLAAWNAVEEGREEDRKAAEAQWGGALIDEEEDRAEVAVALWPWAAMGGASLPWVVMSLASEREFVEMALGSAWIARVLEAPIVGVLLIGASLMMVGPGLALAPAGCVRAGRKLPLWARALVWGALAFCVGVAVMQARG